MNKMKTGLAAVAAAGMGFWATGANAIIIDIGASAGGGPVSEIAGPSPNTNPVSFGTTVGGVTVGSFSVNATATASSTALANDFGSTTLDITNTSSTPSSLTVYVTASEVTGPIGNQLPFISSFTSNVLPTGWTLTEATYIDTGDHTLNNGAVHLLDMATFTSIGVNTPVTALASTGSGPYSLTEVYTLATNGCSAGSGSCSALSTIDLAAVPGPIVGAGFPGLLAACGGLIALARRRRRQTA